MRTTRGTGPGFRPGAPVTVRQEREIAVPPSEVWTVLTGIEAWPLWHPGIHLAILRGELEPGTALHWRIDGMRILSRIAEVEPERRVAWTIRTFGARGYQLWTLEPLRGKGGMGTRIGLQESWEGLVARVLRRTLARTLERSRGVWLDGLKHRAEERHGGP